MAVDADLTFADNPVNAAPRQVTQLAVDEIVQPLSRLVLRDLQMPNRGPDFRAGLHILLPARIVIAVRHCF